MGRLRFKWESGGLTLGFISHESISMFGQTGAVLSYAQKNGLT